MTQNDKNIVLEQDEKDTVFSPAVGNFYRLLCRWSSSISHLQSGRIRQNGNNYSKLAEELLEGKELFLVDGTKVTFQEIVEQRVAADRAEYEEELASMFKDHCDAKNATRDCGDELK